jgi:hypothetical protein
MLWLSSGPKKSDILLVSRLLNYGLVKVGQIWDNDDDNNDYKFDGDDNYGDGDGRRPWYKT